MTLVNCQKCNGTGKVECCNGHMCSGEKDCNDCDGKGKRLSDADRVLKRLLFEQGLMDYK